MADEIVAANVRAAGAVYFAAMLEEAALFAVTDRIAELFMSGQLPLAGPADRALDNYWRRREQRLNADERRALYARVLGLAGGDAAATPRPNREFGELWLRFLSAVSDYARQVSVDATLNQDDVRRCARDLARNLTRHARGPTLRTAAALNADVKSAISVLSDPETSRAFGARDMWQLIDRVAQSELGGARDTSRFRALAQSGASIIGWLADRTRALRGARRARLIDAARDAPLIAAVESWLAAAATSDLAISPESRRARARKRR